jgi:holo-[acyl-carrier protein] synthase
MIFGIGCDCLEVDRFRQAFLRNGDRLLHRLFTPAEIAYCQSHGDPVLSYTGRFAAKEALSKALGIGIGSALSWHDMEIVNDSRGKPSIVWHTRILEELGVGHVHLSISHSHTMAMAYAVAEKV